MAGRMVNLGQVGFGLVADTQELKDSLEVLKVFGREVDRLSKLTSDQAQSAHKWGVTLEGSITKMQAAAQRATRELERLGASQASINEVSGETSKVIKEMVNNWGSLEDQKNRVMRAQVGQQEIINRIVGAEREAARERMQIERDHTAAIIQDQREQQKAINDNIGFSTRYNASLRQTQREQQQILNQNSALTNQVQERVARAQVVGASPTQVTSTQGALQQFLAAPVDQRGTALRNLRGEMSLLNQEIIKSSGVVNTFSQAFRDLERAVILAVGPLSGVGARLAVMSALLESTSFQTAAVIGGIVGLGTAVTLLSINTIKATMDMQRFEALLTASTGSAALAQEEYTKVVDIANKWGFTVREIVEPYAKFTTAARLSGLSLEDQAQAFEAVSVAARATNLNTERTSLVFLALEQMLSKGTVYMEEMRRQLGDLLPGAFQVAAKAMGMTQAEFTKAISEGRILATDLIPKLSDALLTIFGPSATQAAHNLQAEFGRFSTATFELWNSIERTTGVTESFTKIVVAATNAVNYLANNMREIVGMIGAMAGGAAMIALIASWSSLANLWVYARVVALELRTAILALDAAAIASGVGAVGIKILQLTAVIGGAVAGYYLLKPAASEVTDELERQIIKVNQTIDVWGQIGSISEQTSQQLVRQTTRNLRLVSSQIQMAQKDLDAYLEEQKRKQPQLYGEEALFGAANNIEDDPKVKALNATMAKLRQQESELNAIFDDIISIPVDKIDNEKVAGHAFENWIKSVEKDMRQLQTINSEIKNIDLGQEAYNQAKAVGQAMDLLARMPDKDQSVKMMEELLYKLKEMGFTFQGQVPLTEALRESLIKLFAAIDNGNDSLKTLRQRQSEQKEALKTIANLEDDLAARIRGATNALGYHTSTMDSIEKRTEDYRQTLEKLRPEIDRNTEGEAAYYDERVRSYRMSLMMEQALRDYGSALQNSRKEAEHLQDVIGSRMDRAFEKQFDEWRTLQRLVADGAVTTAEAARMMDQINADAYRVALSRATVFGRDMQSFFRKFEDDLANGVADTAMGVKDAWTKMFNQLEHEIIAFAAKVAFIQPMMKMLFGGAYTQNSADMGTGAFEPWLAKLGIVSFSPRTVGPMSEQALADQAYQESLISLDAFGPIENFAKGGSFRVGGYGGTDSQDVRFRASPDETVTISPPGSGGSGSPLQVHINVNNQTSVPIQADQVGSRIDGGKMVVDLLISHASRNADARDSINRVLKEPQH